ncbi:N-acetylmuramoyl-L-alanine amidase AmiD-like isoform X2 [Convolutriloba macropyga]|uniref:N-acetylmuramoyl-L-alanine amidase AmiD-like isoform X2 n=1 Tax=Convolutriloba macropyga TaxID=536237 RepID=UPI003F5250C9
MGRSLNPYPSRTFTCRRTSKFLLLFLVVIFVSIQGSETKYIVTLRENTIAESTKFEEQNHPVIMEYNTTYLRDMQKYPLEPGESGEIVNPQPGKCNNFNYRFKLVDGERFYQEAYPVYIVQHNTVANFSRTVDIFTKGKVSAHFVIDKDGTVYEFVHRDFRAYHAGVGNFSNGSELLFGDYSGMKDNMNSWSIGIENINNGNEPYSKAQMRANVLLCEQLMNEFPTIEAQKMIGHSDWSPGRKIDPNPYFPWGVLANASKDEMFTGLNITQDFGIFPRKANLCLVKDPKIVIPFSETGKKLTEEGTKAQELLTKYGYDIVEQELGVYSDSTRKAILAFWLHFFGEEIVESEILKLAWDKIFKGVAGYSPLFELNENHVKCLEDILEQFAESD